MIFRDFFVLKNARFFYRKMHFAWLSAHGICPQGPAHALFSPRRAWRGVSSTREMPIINVSIKQKKHSNTSTEAVRELPISNVSIKQKNIQTQAPKIRKTFFWCLAPFTCAAAYVFSLYWTKVWHALHHISSPLTSMTPGNCKRTVKCCYNV